ncbi:MAG: BatA domain-containing protein [Planctomycetes bacterium]|nr:BatA domain-containing protein [Planctomycetota bacterium]MCB9884381.1 BatA domain-containing protein [Planctomycetota bacterium]
MIALAFLNPMLLWALPLAAVPIVIHILNRRRFKRVPWAAMEFLLKAMKRNRKRLRMEQWLVLLLRTLAVLLLALLVSRPQLGGGALFGSRTHHVVLLDDSASMRQQSGSTNLFDRARDRVRALAEDLAKRRAGDVLSVVRTSRPDQPDLWQQRVGADLGRRVGTLLKEWSCSDQAPDLGAAARLTVERARSEEQAGRTEYYVVGDQRAHDWVTTDDKPRPALLAMLSGLDATKEHVTVFGVGGSPANVAVVGVRLTDRMLVAGVPATFAAEVRNYGLDPVGPSAVAIEVDGKSRVLQPVPPLAPGERVAVPFGTTFHQAGPHHVDVSFDVPDSYVLDDRRTAAMAVATRSRVLLVDGDPDSDEGETFYLQAAFELGGEVTSGIEVQVISDAMLPAAELAVFDAIWLCNVQSIDAPQAERLEDFVRKGGGLIVACGPQVDAGRYNELLYKGGKGLLPMAIGEVDGDPDRPEHATLVARDHPVCAGVVEALELLTNRVLLVKRWLTLIEEPGSTASVVARIRDAEGPPLLVTKTFGGGEGDTGAHGGEVALLAVTADNFWSNLPATHLFLVLANQLQRFAARRADFSAFNLTSDGTFRDELDPGTYRPDVTARALIGDGDERTFTAAAAKPAPTGPQPGGDPAPAPATTKERLELTVPMRELRQLGAYALDFVRHDGDADERRIARNVSVEESNMTSFPVAAFARTYPAEVHDRVTFVVDAGQGARDAEEGEVWRWLAMALVAGLLLESVLAWRFGRH